MNSLLKALFIAPVLAQAEAIWIEAESATDKSIQNNSWYSDVNRAELSGENFLAHWGNQVGEATFNFNLPTTGHYSLWLRANPVASKLEVQFDSGNWTSIPTKKNSHESINIASNGKPDLRFVAWIRGEKTKLQAGDHQLKIRFTSENNHHGMLDCFCLTTDDTWKPTRSLKPGEKAAHWPAPKITNTNLDQWIKFIRPSAQESGWQNVRWHRSLSEAADEAKELNRPILLWAMNGHPCGET